MDCLAWNTALAAPWRPRAPRALQWSRYGLVGSAGWVHGLVWSQTLEAGMAPGVPWWAAALLLMLVPLAAAGWWWAWREHRVAARLRQALQRARQLNDGLAHTLDVWQWQTDVEHRLVACRPPRSANATTWSAVGVGGLLWELFPSTDVQALKARLDARSTLEDVPVKQAWKSADARPSLLRGTPLTDGEGRFAGYVGTLREAALLEHRGEPSVVAARVVAALPAPAGPGDNEHESFIYTVSHDLRAPIRVVEGFTKILREDYGRLLDRIGNDHLDRILSAAARMNHMIDALLALSQLSTQPLGRQLVDLSQLASYIADDLRRQSPEREVQVHIAPGMQAMGDPTLLRVVLENLLGNAWKYTGKCAQARIWFERHPDGTVTYTVRDNGAGFDMRFADRLFGAFQRLHSANDFQGTGIGLASVRRIVRRHGGDVWAEAQVDQGARFHFSLAPDNALRSDRQA